MEGWKLLTNTERREVLVLLKIKADGASDPRPYDDAIAALQDIIDTPVSFTSVT